MKKSLTVFTLLLCIATQALAQTDVMQYPSFEPPKNGLGSKIIKLFNTPITKKALVNGAKIATGFVVANKFKFVIGGAVLSGVAGYNNLIQNPEKMSEFFSTHPELLDEFTNYVDYRIEHAQSQEEYDTFNNVKQRAFLDIDVNHAEELAIQNSYEFKQIQAQVESKIIDVDLQLTQLGKMPTNCSKIDLEQLTINKDSFQNTINLVLPKIQSQLGKTTILDVNTYNQLFDGYKKSNKIIPLQQDHIPSYAAIDKFLNRLGVATKTTIRVSSKGENKTIRDKDLEANETAITVPTEIHKLGRTFFGKNTQKKIEGDSNNLLLATVLDISTTALAFAKTPSYGITADQYIDSALMIYLRNKLLCMYDVP